MQDHCAYQVCVTRTGADGLYRAQESDRLDRRQNAHVAGLRSLVARSRRDVRKGRARARLFRRSQGSEDESVRWKPAGPGRWQIGSSGESEIGARLHFRLQVTTQDPHGWGPGEAKRSRVSIAGDSRFLHGDGYPCLLSDSTNGVTRRFPVASARCVEDVDGDGFGTHEGRIRRAAPYRHRWRGGEELRQPHSRPAGPIA